MLRAPRSILGARRRVRAVVSLVRLAFNTRCGLAAVAERWEGAVDFDGDPFNRAIGVLGVASEPAPCIGAGTDDLSVIGAQDSELAYGQGGDHETHRFAGFSVPYRGCSVH